MKRSMTKVSLTMAALLLGHVFGIANAQVSTPTPLPYESDNVHLGVTSCAGGTCHGSTIQRSSNVEQNEYLVWNNDEFPDLHSSAYEVLLSEQSKRIAYNLGLDSAHEADICLTCHTDFVPADRRGENFSFEDGIGCEACHGGADQYLEAHDDGDHGHNLELGLYPTEDPIARAELCLSCHYGNPDKFVTHQIMGAGHPRLKFELDTFTADQPAHFLVDEDYVQRKSEWDGVQTWAAGQAAAARHFVDAMEHIQDNDGLFPELTLFDCHSCHHSMDEERWQAQTSVGLKPGSLRLNDATLLMTYKLAKVVAPELAPALRDGITQLHQATRNNYESIQQATLNLKDILDRIQQSLAGHEFSDSDFYALIDTLITGSSDGAYRDYMSAEQTVMAISSALVALEQVGNIGQERANILFDALQGAYRSLENDQEFNQQNFQKALESFKQVLDS